MQAGGTGNPNLKQMAQPSSKRARKIIETSDPATILACKTTARGHLDRATDYPGVPARLRKRVKEFMTQGICTYEPGLTKAQVRSCRKHIYNMFDTTMSTIKRLDKLEDLEKIGFTNFKLRHKGRYDLQIDAFKGEAFDYLRESAPWLPLVRAILGEGCVLGHSGVMLSLPGSETQPWHSDGPHLNHQEHDLPHCVNVFVPLVHITAQNGGTEMVPETHLLGAYEDESCESRTVQAKSGTCILFDYRLRHRGLGNRTSDVPRPLMYLTYCQPHYRDDANFSSGRYMKELPKMTHSLSRKQRADKRTQGIPDAGSGSTSGTGTDMDTDAGAGKVAPGGPTVVEDPADNYSATFGVIDYDSDDDVQAAPIATRPVLSKEEKCRAARAHHRKKAAACERVNGIPIYTDAPVLAIDKTGWYPAKVIGVDAAKRTLRIHFNGWHKRFDFTCPFDSGKIKAPKSSDMLVTSGRGMLEEVTLAKT